MAVEPTTLSLYRTNPMRGSRPVWLVMSWELRRLRAARSSWMMAGAAFFCFMGILWVRNQWGLSENTNLLGTTKYGQLAELVYDLMLIFGLFLPFLAADGVAVDFQQRTHELVMTTAMPSWAFAWGRYLARLVVSLGLAALLLAAQTGMNFVLALTDSTYPIPNPPAALIFWVTIVIPATILVCSLSFSLGTLIPRFTVIPKVAVCIAWCILVLDTDPTDLGWRVYWNPTGAGLAKIVIYQLHQTVGNAIRGLPNATQQSQMALTLQQQMPDLRPWIGPYLALAALGIVLTALAVRGFRRFRECLQS